MSRLSEILEKLITKVNESVSTGEQQLTPEQQERVKKNLGIKDSEQVEVNWANLKDKPFHVNTVERWVELLTNKNDNDTPITITDTILTKPLRFKFITPSGVELVVSEGDSGVQVKWSENDTKFVFLYLGKYSGVVGEFRVSGKIDGSGFKIEDLVTGTNYDTVSVYSHSELVVDEINEDSIPDNLARISPTELNNLEDMLDNNIMIGE